MSVQARKSASVWAAVPSLDEDLASTTIMSIKDLRGFWKLRWGDPPRYRSRDHLARAIAYRLQANVHARALQQWHQATALLAVEQHGRDGV